MSEDRSNRDDALQGSARQLHPEQNGSVPHLSRPMSELLVSIWRAHRRLEQGGEPERVMFMVQRHIDAAMSRLDEMGIELRTYDGQTYDPGMRAIVPSQFEPDPTVSRETVGETTAPAIFVNGKVASKSQATIRVPAADKPEASPQRSKASASKQKQKQKTRTNRRRKK